MNAYLYIPTLSYHSPAVFKSFIQSEIRRYTRNSTNTVDVDIMRKLLYDRLVARGYCTQYLSEIMSVQYDRVSVLFTPRALRLYGVTLSPRRLHPAIWYPFTVPLGVKVYQPADNDVVVFKINHSPSFTARVLKSILLYSNPLHSLRHDPVQCITNPIVCYQRSQSVGDILISAKYDYDFPF